MLGYLPSEAKFYQSRQEVTKEREEKHDGYENAYFAI